MEIGQWIALAVLAVTFGYLIVGNNKLKKANLSTDIELAAKNTELKTANSEIKVLTRKLEDCKRTATLNRVSAKPKTEAKPRVSKTIVTSKAKPKTNKTNKTTKPKAKSTKK